MASELERQPNAHEIEASTEPFDALLAGDFFRCRACTAYAAERRARLQAQEASRVREQFLSVAAHELKTPLTSLRGYTQAVLRQFDRHGTLDPDLVCRALQVIDKQADRLARLVSQLFDASCIEARELVLHRQVVDLSRVAGNVAAAAQAETSQHTLVVCAPSPVPAAVDPRRLAQVLANLIDNAIKYSPDGGEIELEVSQSSPETARLVVTDHGTGIPPEYRQRLFERFHQAHAGEHRSGMGLGLYVSRQIVELHGGRLLAEHPPEGGTRFVVELPAEPAGAAGFNSTGATTCAGAAADT